MQGFSVHDADGAKRVPTSPARQGFSAADDVNRDNGSTRSCGDESDSWFCFSQVAIEGALTLWKENKSSFVFQDFKDVFERGGAGGFLIDGDGADGGKQPRAHGGGEERVSREVVGDPRKAAADGGWIEEAGVVGS